MSECQNGIFFSNEIVTCIIAGGWYQGSYRLYSISLKCWKILWLLFKVENCDELFKQCFIGISSVFANICLKRIFVWKISMHQLCDRCFQSVGHSACWEWLICKSVAASRQTSTIHSFATIVNNLKPLTFVAILSILDVWWGSCYSNGFLH